MNYIEQKVTEKTFGGLSTYELYKILQLRSAIFVVEQNSVYQDVDDADLASVHLWLSHADEMVAYLRVLPKGTKYAQHASIGRVVVAKAFRGKCLSAILIERAMAIILTQWHEKSIQIQAQAYLEKFYQSFGFQTISEPYIADELPHIDMIYKHQ